MADLSELLREAFQELKSQELTFWLHLVTHHGSEPEDEEVASLVALGRLFPSLAERRLARIAKAYAQRRVGTTHKSLQAIVEWVQGSPGRRMRIKGRACGTS